jgi:hypothetical protein
VPSSATRPNLDGSPISADAALGFAGVMLIDPGLICSVMVLPFQRVGVLAFVV